MSTLQLACLGEADLEGADVSSLVEQVAVGAVGAAAGQVGRGGGSGRGVPDRVGVDRPRHGDGGR